MIYIGTSGFSYGHWTNGRFYPGACDLAYYLDHFNVVEMNVTFYRLPQESTFKLWHQRTPNDFRFVFKVPRFISHMKKLVMDEAAVGAWNDFFDRLDVIPKKKLGPLLLQIPHGFHLNAEKLRNTLRLARSRGYRIAFEARHDSWIAPETTILLKEHAGAHVAADWRQFNLAPSSDDSFLYLRRHGPKRMYSGSYSLAQLRKMAEEIVQFTMQRREAYVFFNNDGKAAAPYDAMKLNQLLLGKP
jgi:uncharacterized protein YecE (DUF72 family)